ncbi:replication protein A 32 kDa subunit A-like [Amaranthus tricolor]|uniref:replication protein A 32 kDa subunit A-like n=1 Tax=Amaranthus tricolor TaxID=29722 RepID=UPI002590B5D5|nr:replication protein A 32 kDa subunit A-like [Amaranthus tricolor]
MMFSQSQYENGFTSSQLTQSDSSPSTAKNRYPQGTIPVTVKQISQASPSSTDDKANFNIDGVDVTNVKLLGMVFDKTEKVTDVSFILDDGTGRIGCKRWLNEAFDRKQMEVVEDGMYVRLVGHLKSSRGTAEIVVFNLRPVTDFNEITLHQVECIHQHLLNNKSQKGDSLQNVKIESSQSTPVKVESNEFLSSPLNQVSMQMSVDGLKDIDQRILDFLQQSSSLAQEKGVHRDEIARHLKVPMEKIMESITCLEDEGLIYSTIDDFHFKSTAA